MPLRARLVFTPRIYCLTLPGSTRQKQMIPRLNDTGLPWEFVYGVYRPAPENIEWDYIKNCDFIQRYPAALYTTYLRGAAGCKDGFRRMLKKILADSDPYCLFCTDDVSFVPDFKKKLEDLIKKLPKNIGACGLCHAMSLKYQQYVNYDFSKCVGRCRIDWLCVIRRWLVKHYLIAMETEGAESDVSFERYIKKSGHEIYISNTQLADPSEESNDSVIGYSL